MYDSLSKVVGGQAVYFDTYPDFRIDLDRLADTITPRTKAIIFNSPGNPTGVVPDEEDGSRAGRAGGAAKRGDYQRRDLSGVLLRRAVRLAGQVQSRHAGDRRFQQDLRDARLAVGLRARAVGDHPRDDQVAAVQFHLRPAADAMGGGRGDGHRHDPHIDAYRRKRDMIVAGLADDYEMVTPGGGVLRLPQGPLGHGHRFRPARHRKVQAPNRPRQRLQPPRHAISASPTPSPTR